MEFVLFLILSAGLAEASATAQTVVPTPVGALALFCDLPSLEAVALHAQTMADVPDPIVGFSPAFVRAGAAAGVDPDYRAAGRQTAEMALRLKRGEAPCEVCPAKIQVAVNQRMMRLLGIDLRVPPGVEVYR